MYGRRITVNFAKPNGRVKYNKVNKNEVFLSKLKDCNITLYRKIDEMKYKVNEII